MGKHNRTWTDGSIDRGPEMKITWNWQSSRFSVKFLFIVPRYIYKFRKWNYGKPGKNALNAWAKKQHTYLQKEMTQKNLKTFDWSLLKTYKLLTSVVTDRTYFYLKQNDFFLPEQKGSRHGSYGCCKLMINKMKLENCKKWKRNLSYSVVNLSSKRHLMSSMSSMIE